jgi:hypothetical protein
MIKIARVIVTIAITAPVVFDASGQSVQPTRVVVREGPIPFSYFMPISWVNAPIVSGNTKVSVSPPKGQWTGNCSILTLEDKSISASQSEINAYLEALPTTQELEKELGATLRNVRVESVQRTLLSGYPARRMVLSHGSNGAFWTYGYSTLTILSPNVVITATCGGIGKTLEAARASYNGLHTELQIFPTTIKVFNR